MKALESLDIVLSIFNQEALIEKVLEGIARNTTTPFNLVLIFDGCTDDSMNKALSYLKDARPKLLRELRTATSQNVYETKANNIGFRMCTEPLMITLQDDMVINEKGWEKRLTYPLRAYDDIFAVTARTALNISFKRGGDLPVYTDMAARESFTLHRNCLEIRSIINRGPVAFRSDILKRLDYLDESFAPAQLDEADLVLRAREQLGMKCGALWIAYRSDDSWGKTRAVETSMNTRASLLKNARLLLAKHPGLADQKASRIYERRTVKDSEIDYSERDPFLNRLMKDLCLDLYFLRRLASRKFNGLKVRLARAYTRRQSRHS